MIQFPHTQVCPPPDELNIIGLAGPGIDSVTVTIPDTSACGLPPVERPDSSRPHSAVTALIIVIFTIIALAGRHLRHILRSMETDILGVRRRNNAFDTHTSAESRTLAILIFLAAICETILLGAHTGSNATSSLPLFGALLGVTTGYYIFQLIAYSIVGYTFTDTINASQWRRGFNLSQGLLGLLLLPPALITLFYPSAAGVMIAIGGAIYIIVRITFIYKGFRIFYESMSSFVYFILYLCALEIIPLIAVYSAAMALDRLY